MKRDLNDYQEQYKNQPYERYQVMFRKRKIKECLLKYKHDSILEIGCGFEPIFLDIHDFSSMIVVEPADIFYQNAQKQINNISDNKKIRLIHKMLEDSVQDLRGETFDFILLSSLLHEIKDVRAFLRNLYELADPNTVVHINVPNAQSFHRLLAVEMGLIKNEYEKSASNIQFQQATVFDLPSLKALLHENKFKVIDEGSYAFKPFTHRQMEDLIQSGFINDNMLNGFYGMEKHLPRLGSEIYVNVKKVL